MRGLVALLAGLTSIAAPACAEPLFLRIRPGPVADEPAASSPPSSGATETEIAARAHARHEAVWMRSERRARIAIASVCTGCLKPISGRPAASDPSSVATSLHADLGRPSGRDRDDPSSESR